MTNQTKLWCERCEDFRTRDEVIEFIPNPAQPEEYAGYFGRCRVCGEPTVKQQRIREE